MPKKVKDSESPVSASPGRPRKLTDSEILQTLMEIKVTDQLSWAQLAEWYENEYGEHIGGETIRQAILKDAPMLLVPGMVSKKVKLAIDTIWERVDLMRIIMFMVNARFTEWSQLYEKMMRASLEDSDEPNAIKFSPEEQFRMDDLYNGVVSFFLRALDAMKELSQGNMALPELGSLLILSNSPKGEGVDDNVDSGIGELIQRVSIETQTMLIDINERHRAAGRGAYRVINDDEDEGADAIGVDE